MSRRTRGTRRTAHQRSARRPPPNRGGRIASPLEVAQVAAQEIERGDLATAAHELERADGSQARTPGRAGPQARPGSYLAARAASEYVYVGQDLRHIAIVAGLIFGIMAILFALIEVAHAVRF